MSYKQVALLEIHYYSVCVALFQIAGSPLVKGNLQNHCLARKPLTLRVIRERIVFFDDSKRARLQSSIHKRSEFLLLSRGVVE